MLKVNTENYINLLGIAEETLRLLGVRHTPLTEKFLLELFEDLQLHAPKTGEWYNLQDQVADMKEGQEANLTRIERLEQEKSDLYWQNDDLRHDLARLRFKEQGGVINWDDMCARNPSNKIAMIKEIRQLLNLGLKDAKDLVDANVKSVKIFPNEATSKEVYVPVKESQ